MLFHEEDSFDKADPTLKLRVVQCALSICKMIKLNDYNQPFFYVGVTDNLTNRLQHHDKEFRYTLVFDFDYQDRVFVKALEAYLVNKYNFKNDLRAKSSYGTIFYVLRIY